MGAAIGYALLESSSSTYPIFLSLSMGFAFPYILLALKPSLIQKLPKPGNWMNLFKEFMAFPMFATAIWLLWVFSLQVSTISLIELILIWLSIFTTWKINFSVKYFCVISPSLHTHRSLFLPNQFLRFTTLIKRIPRRSG